MDFHGPLYKTHGNDSNAHFEGTIKSYHIPKFAHQQTQGGKVLRFLCQELGNASSFDQSLGNPSIAVLPVILQTELTLAVSPSLFTGLHQTYKNKSCICSLSSEVHLKITKNHPKSAVLSHGFPTPQPSPTVPYRSPFGYRPRSARRWCPRRPWRSPPRAAPAPRSSDGNRAPHRGEPSCGPAYPLVN